MTSLVGTTTFNDNGQHLGTSTTPNVSLTGISMSEGDCVIVALGQAWRRETVSAANLAVKDPSAAAYTAMHSADRQANGSYDLNVLVQYKFMGATPDSYVTLPAIVDNDAGMTATVIVLRGVNDSTIADIAAVLTTGTGAGTPDCGSITSTVDGSYILAIGFTGFNWNGTGTEAVYTTPSGMDGIVTVMENGRNYWENGCISGLAYYEQATAGAYNPAAFGGGAGWAGAIHIGVTLVIPPASAGGTTVSAGKATAAASANVMEIATTLALGKAIATAGASAAGIIGSVLPGKASAAASANAPNLIATTSLALGKADAAAEANAPVLTSSLALGNASATTAASAMELRASIALGKAGATASANHASMSGAVSIALGKAMATANAYAATVIDTTSLALGKAAATAGALAMSITSTLALGKATATASARAATLLGTTTIALGKAMATAGARAATISVGGIVALVKRVAAYGKRFGFGW